MRPRCAASVEPDVTCVRRPRGGGGERVASRARAVKIIYKSQRRDSRHRRCGPSKFTWRVTVWSRSDKLPYRKEPYKAVRVLPFTHYSLPEFPFPGSVARGEERTAVFLRLSIRTHELVGCIFMYHV